MFATEFAAQAVVEIKKKVEKISCDEKLYGAAVSCMAGVMKTIVKGDAGHFAQEILERINKKST